MSQPNVELVRSSLDGWSRGDIGAWLASCHPDIEFRTSGVYPGLDPIYRGRVELRHFWEVMREPWESLQIRIEQVREAGDQLVSLCVFEGHAREGMTVRREVAWTWDEALAAVGLGE